MTNPDASPRAFSVGPSRRDALARLAALFALPFARWPGQVSGAAWIEQVERGLRLDDPLAGTIVQYQAGRLDGRWSAVEVTRLALERCETQGRALRAIDLLAADALDAARDSDANLARRALRGPLDGVPVFAKSIYDVRGLPTTGSSAAWAKLFPDAVRRDSLEVQRLRAAHAVVLGKTAADDFAYRGNGTSSLTGQVLNPHDRRGVKTPGGSSAGSAVAVLTGLAFAALGTDDGGSNRIPAQFCGVVGMKPSFGVVPRTGVIPTWPFLDTHGPLARTVGDAALLLDAIAGPDDSDPLALVTPWRRGPVGAVARRRGSDALKGARLGRVEAHLPLPQMTDDARAAWTRAESDLIAAGAVVEAFTPSVTRWTVGEMMRDASKARGDVPPDANAPAPTANALLRYFAGQGIDARVAVARGLDAFRAFYDVLPASGDEMLRLCDQPMQLDAAGVSFARSRATLLEGLAASFRAANIEAMVYPTMPFEAPRAVDPWPDVRTPLGYGNQLGLPEVSVPAGLARDGMPTLNLSFVGLPGSDVRLLELAHAYESASRRFVIPGGR